MRELANRGRGTKILGIVADEFVNARPTCSKQAFGIPPRRGSGDSSSMPTAVRLHGCSALAVRSRSVPNDCGDAKAPGSRMMASESISGLCFVLCLIEQGAPVCLSGMAMAWHGWTAGTAYSIGGTEGAVALASVFFSCRFFPHLDDRHHEENKKNVNNLRQPKLPWEGSSGDGCEPRVDSGECNR